jgi:hypothetical protein
MVEIVPSHTTYKARDVAELMFENVYKHHGLPKTIVSDRDVLFTSTFWNHLNALIGVRLKMSSAYHPQTDGATERANRTVTQMLRQCINPNQKDWVSKLPTIQFAINSARSESTGYAPFFLNNGRMPRAMVWNAADPAEYSNVREFALKKKLALMSAHDSIIGARIKQTRDANRRRQLVPFKEGDFVYLSTKNITFAKGLARKLIPKFIGPYKVTKDFDNQSELPTHLKRRGVHDVFHSSLLRIHMPNDDRLFPGRMDTQLRDNPDSEDEWAVERIQSHAESGENSIFEMLWKSGDVTWMPLYQIKHLQAFEAYLELLGIDDASKLPTGKGKPPQGDPQVYLGATNFDDPTQSLPPISDYSQLVSMDSEQQLHEYPHLPLIFRYKEALPIRTFHVFYTSSSTIIDNITDFDYDDIYFPRELEPPHISKEEFTSLFSEKLLAYCNLVGTMPNNLNGIKHQNFHRLSDTKYRFTDENLDRVTIHTGQIMIYLEFDQALRNGKKLFFETEGLTDIFVRGHPVPSPPTPSTQKYIPPHRR